MNGKLSKQEYFRLKELLMSSDLDNSVVAIGLISKLSKRDNASYLLMLYGTHYENTVIGKHSNSAYNLWNTNGGQEMLDYLNRLATGGKWWYSPKECFSRAFSLARSKEAKQFILDEMTYLFKRELGTYLEYNSHLQMSDIKITFQVV